VTFTKFAAAPAICLALAGFGAARAAPSPITIATGPVAAFAFPLGGEICRLYEGPTQNGGTAQDGARCTVAATDGSVENINRLRSGELTLAIVQSDIAADAVSASGPFTGAMPFTDLRGVVGFYSQALTVLVKADGNIKMPDDLKGQRIAVGAPGAPEPLFADYLEGLGWHKAELGGIVEMPRAEQVPALCDGKVAAIAVTAAHPNGFVREALAACHIAILDLAGPGIDAAIAAHPAYSAAKLDLGLYAGQSGAVQSFGPRAVLVTTAKLDDATVERLLTGIFKHLDDLKKAHPAFATMDAATLASPNGLGAEGHPAASKFIADKKIGDAPGGD
jgi:TRAP transporter TAXI family solute receptor